MFICNAGQAEHLLCNASGMPVLYSSGHFFSLHVSDKKKEYKWTITNIYNLSQLHVCVWRNTIHCLRLVSI